MPAAAPIIASAAISSGVGAAFGFALPGLTVLQTAIVGFVGQTPIGSSRMALGSKGLR